MDTNTFLVYLGALFLGYLMGFTRRHQKYHELNSKIDQLEEKLKGEKTE